MRDYCISNFVPDDTTSALQGAVLRVSVSFSGEACTYSVCRLSVVGRRASLKMAIVQVFVPTAAEYAALGRL